jgi:hypothetical protein
MDQEIGEEISGIVTIVILDLGPEIIDNRTV